MNEENAKSLWKAIQKAGEMLDGKLPPSPKHPNGRNAFAHLPLCIKSEFGMTYKDIPDERIGEVLDYLVYLVENPF